MENREALGDMLRRYRLCLHGLTDTETQLLSVKIATLAKVLWPGFATLNWMSLGIHEFVIACDDKINEFIGLTRLVRKNAGLIEQVVREIELTVVAHEPLSGDLTPDFIECVAFTERERTHALAKLARRYQSIPPLLGKIEEAVAGTNTGTSDQLHGYYQYWEARVFHALRSLVLNSLRAQILTTNARDVEAWQRRQTGDGAKTDVSPTAPPPSPLFNVRYVSHLPNPASTFYLSAGDCCPYIEIYKALTLFWQNSKGSCSTLRKFCKPPLRETCRNTYYLFPRASAKARGTSRGGRTGKYFPLTTFRLCDCPYETDTFFFIGPGRAWSLPCRFWATTNRSGLPSPATCRCVPIFAPRARSWI